MPEDYTINSVTDKPKDQPNDMPICSDILTNLSDIFDNTRYQALIKMDPANPVSELFHKAKNEITAIQKQNPFFHGVCDKPPNCDGSCSLRKLLGTTEKIKTLLTNQDPATIFSTPSQSADQRR